MAKPAKVLSSNGVVVVTENMEILKELEVADGLSVDNGLMSPALTQLKAITQCQFKMNDSYFTLLADTGWSTTDAVEELIAITEGAEIYYAFTF